MGKFKFSQLCVNISSTTVKNENQVIQFLMNFTSTCIIASILVLLLIQFMLPLLVFSPRSNKFPGFFNLQYDVI